MAVPRGVYRLGWGPVWVYLIEDEQGCVLIDTGLFFEHVLVTRKLRQIGRSWRDVRAILLTHGHLDHAANLHHIRRLTDAPVYAHPIEQTHLDGRWPYRGIARVCGAMEAIGRAALRYRPVKIDVPIHDGDVLDLWGGLHVVHLPGHSAGHCGFYSPKHRTLFSGDLCAIPPAIFNSVPEHFGASFRRMWELNPEMILPNHCLWFDGHKSRAKFTAYFTANWARGLEPE